MFFNHIINFFCVFFYFGVQFVFVFLYEKGCNLAQIETDVYFCLCQLASNAKIKKTDASGDIEKRRK
jgi:hypothetical protein